MAEPTNWTCPHCNRPQTLTDGQQQTLDVYLGQNNNKYGNLGFVVGLTACTNPECRDVTVVAHLTTGAGQYNNFAPEKILHTTI
jgi:hypothetical protein